MINITYSPECMLSFRLANDDEETLRYQINPADLPYGEGGIPASADAPVYSRLDYPIEEVKRLMYLEHFEPQVSSGPLSFDAAYAKLYNDFLSTQGPLDMQKLDYAATRYYFAQYLAPSLVAEEDRAKDLSGKIPIYKESALLDGNQTITLGRDHVYFQLLRSAEPQYVPPVLLKRPTTAIRMQGEHMYFIYETNTGHRLYLFTGEVDYWSEPLCFMNQIPILIRERQSVKDFASLKKGDPIEKVVAIDQSTSPSECIPQILGL